jgi:hypothetical protein
MEDVEHIGDSGQNHPNIRLALTNLALSFRPPLLDLAEAP